MLVKFTNRTEGRIGDPIYINANHIISVFENPRENGSLSTIIYGGDDKTWIVEESLLEAIRKINEAFSKSLVD